LKTLHRFVGLAAAIPLLLWALTGVVFLTKPGYEGAYERLSPNTHPMPDEVELSTHSDWREMRLLRTVLGDHLIVRGKDAWRHLDPETLAERDPPSDSELEALVADAIASNPARYGNVVDATDGVVTTDKGVVITLDWSRLEFTQRGNDTRLIDSLYRIHYLQWLGEPVSDKVLGVAGLVLLIALLASGITMQFMKRK